MPSMIWLLALFALLTSFSSPALADDDTEPQEDWGTEEDDDTRREEATGRRVAEEDARRLATVHLLSVPEGSTLTFMHLAGGADSGVHAPLEVLRGEGILDSKLGINVVERITLEDMESGVWTYHFEHPVLGSLDGDFKTVGGKATIEHVEWRKLPGVKPLSQAYSAYMTDPPEGLGRTGWLAIASTGVGLGGGAMAGQGYSGLPEATAAREQFSAAYDVDVANGDAESGKQSYLQLAQANSMVRQSHLIGATGASLTLVGGVTTVVLWKRWSANRGEEVWDPWSLPAP